MRRYRLAILIAALFLIFIIVLPLLSSGIGLLVDWWWFNQVGYREFFTTVLGTELGLGFFGACVFLLLAGLNLVATQGVAKRSRYLKVTQTIEIPGGEKLPSIFRGLLWLVLVFFAWTVGQWSATHWNSFLFATHGVNLAQKDPILGINLGFYLFRLPFLFFLYHLALIILAACLVTAAASYFVEGGIWISQRGWGIGRNARRHLMVVGGVFFLLFAWRARLGMYDLVYAPGLVYGAGYTDIHVGWPVLWIELALCIVAAIAFFAGAFDGQIRPAEYAVGGVIAAAILGGWIAPALVQSYFVAPSELEKEQPYIARNIAFTRQAYGLDRFDERNFPAVQDLTPASVEQNSATMRNLRLWDQDAQLTAFQQLQEIRTYYDFAHVYYDRYTINSELRQVSLSARELSASSLPDPNWVNQHLIYTHGYGLCLGPVNESTPDGLPNLFIKNIPPESSIPSLKVTRPQIYYGQLSNNYCFVKSSAKEFDYPSGEDNVYTVYRGAGGVPVGSLWRRLIFALRYGDTNIFFSGYLQPSSRIMIYRRTLQRVEKLAPFLSYDSHPYMVIANDGSLYWIVDAYTVSSQYPYSEPTDGVGNYVRNSVKITINAYNGEVKFYVSDPSDPLIQTYQRIFPDAFHPLSEMPPDLHSHIRYPQDFFAIQAAKYAVYHMTDPSVFYSKEDLWRVATRTVNGSSTPMNPYYAVMKLPEIGKSEEFILMVPFTPARKNNMVAWMAARCDGADYGKVLVFTFPKDKLVYGPEQIQSRVNQSPSISQQLTLWDQGGSRVTRGTLLVVPVQNAVMYVEPLYLVAEGGSSIPELKRVIVAYFDHVAMEPTLEEALNVVFGGQAGQTEAASTGSPTIAPQSGKGVPVAIEKLIQLANRHFQQAQQDLRSGDWTGYGQEMQQLGQTLKQMPSDSSAKKPVAK